MRQFLANLIVFIIGLNYLSLSAFADLSAEHRQVLHQRFMEKGYLIGGELEIPDGPLANLMGNFDFTEYQINHPELVYKIPIKMVQDYLLDSKNLEKLPKSIQNKLTSGLNNLHFDFEHPHEDSLVPRAILNQLQAPAGTILGSNGLPLRRPIKVPEFIYLQSLGESASRLEIHQNVRVRIDWDEVNRRWLHELTPAERRAAIDISGLSVRDRAQLVVDRVIVLTDLKLKGPKAIPREIIALFENIESEYDLIYQVSGAEISEFKHRRPYSDDRAYFKNLKGFSLRADVWDWMQTPRAVFGHSLLEGRAPGYHFHLSRPDIIPEKVFEGLNLLKLCKGWKRGVNYMEDGRASRVVFHGIDYKGLIRRIMNNRIEVRSQLDSPEEELYETIQYLENPELIYRDLSHLLRATLTVDRFKIIISTYLPKVSQQRYAIGEDSFRSEKRSLADALRDFQKLLASLWLLQSDTSFDFVPIFSRAVAELEGMSAETSPQAVFSQVLEKGQYRGASSFESDAVSFQSQHTPSYAAVLAVVSSSPDPAHVAMQFKIANNTSLTQIFTQWKAAPPANRQVLLEEFSSHHSDVFSENFALKILMTSRNLEVVEFLTDLWLSIKAKPGSDVHDSSIRDVLLEYMASRLESESPENREMLIDFLLTSKTTNTFVTDRLMPYIESEEFIRKYDFRFLRFALNSKDPRIEQRIIQIIQSDAPLYLKHAAMRALDTSRSPEVKKFLVDLLQNSPDSDLRREAAGVLVQMFKKSPEINILLDHLQVESSNDVQGVILNGLQGYRVKLSLSQQRSLLRSRKMHPNFRYIYPLENSEFSEILATLYFADENGNDDLNEAELDESQKYRFGHRSYLSKHICYVLSEAKRNIIDYNDKLDRVSDNENPVNRHVWLTLEKAFRNISPSQMKFVLKAFEGQTVIELLEFMYPEHFVRDTETRELSARKWRGIVLQLFIERTVMGMIQQAIQGQGLRPENCSHLLEFHAR